MATTETQNVASNLLTIRFVFLISTINGHG